MAQRANAKSGLAIGLRRQAWIVVGVLVVVTAGSVYVLRRKDMPANPMIPSTAMDLSPTVELKFTDVHMQGRQNGVVHWTIEGPTVEVSQNQRTVYFDGHPHGLFFNLKDWSDKPPVQQHNRTVTWKADRAQYDDDFKQMAISGHDDFVTDKKDHLTTQNVIYRETQHLVNITTPLQLRGQDGKLVIHADQATADTQLEVLELSGHVQIDSKVAAGDSL